MSPSLFPPMLSRHWVRVACLTATLAITIAALVLNSGEDELFQERAASRVEVIPLAITNETITVSGFGTVEPSRTLDLSAQVSGHLLSIHPQLEQGGIIRTNEVLAQVDPRDYEIDIDARWADLARAESDLKAERGNQLIAKREWELLGGNPNRKDSEHELALRVPNIKEREAALQSAQSQLQRALLNLDRTTIRAPFDALVLSKNVEVGGYIYQAGTVARLVSIDRFFVKVLIADDQLRWLDFRAEPNVDPAPRAVLVTPAHVDSQSSRPGQLLRILGSVDTTGRMIQLLVAVEHPLDTSSGLLPLLLGTYVKVDIPSVKIPDVIKIPRSVVRPQNKVYVADAKGRLRIRDLQMAHATEGDLLVRNTFATGDRLVISPIDTPLEGSRLEIAEAQRP